jgi:hypothetical protein
MSVSITYSVPKNRLGFDSNYGSNELVILKKIKSDLLFESKDAEILRGAGVATGMPFFQEIIDLLFQYGQVQLHEEY